MSILLLSTGLSFCLVCFLSCSREPLQDGRIRVKIVERVDLAGVIDSNKFLGIFKCAVIQNASRFAEIQIGQELNVVVANPEFSDAGFFVHENAEISIHENRTYDIQIGTTLPKGWGDIEGPFNTTFFGLAALEAIY